MSNAPTLQPSTWQIAISPSAYNRTPLTPIELRALKATVRLGERSRGINGADYAKEELQRFQEPIYDVMALRIKDHRICRQVRRVLYLQMIERGTSFWEWTKQEWLAIVCPSYQDFVQAHGNPGSGRQSIKDMAYLLGGVTDLREVAQRINALQTARLYFGKDIVDEQAGRIFALFVGHAGQGYTTARVFMETLGQTLGLLFLLNRSPLLADLSPGLLHQASQPPDALRPAQIHTITWALQQLQYLQLQSRSPLRETPVMGSREEGETAGIAPAWAAWCQAWLTHVLKVTPRARMTYTALLTVGRWLADRHPEVVEPSQWSEDLALEYVNYLCSSATAGDYASLQGTKTLVSKGVVGKKLTPRSIKQRLAVLARFFLDLRDRPHRIDNEEPRRMVLRFNPSDAFRLPAAVKNLIQPDPRDIDEVLWCKLTYAAATITAEDYPKTSPSP